MITVDNLLLKIANFADPAIETQVPKRDCKVLRSLASSVVDQFFITENQSKLLVKILKENSKNITNFSQEIDEALKDPCWSKSFREIEQVRKLFISKNSEDELVLVVELSFNSEIRKILTNLSKQHDTIIVGQNGKRHYADLTEKNVVILVDALAPYDFDIDEKVKNHYDTIKSWSEQDYVNQFKLTNITNSNFQKHITDDLGISTEITQSIINDRSVRYQFFTENPKNLGETLTDYIANRPSTKLWIDKNQHQLSDVIASLKDLKRLPILVIFDTLVTSKYLENLQILSKSLQDNNITDRIGIYFRLENDEVGSQFNQLIKNQEYNYELGQDTQVVAVMSGKLPKFFIKNAWRPMSVLCLDSRMGMRHGKTAVYANSCDLVIEWAEQPAIMEQPKIGLWRQN
jgi:hypothetical protein